MDRAGVLGNLTKVFPVLPLLVQGLVVYADLKSLPFGLALNPAHAYTDLFVGLASVLLIGVLTARCITVLGEMSEIWRQAELDRQAEGRVASV